MILHHSVLGFIWADGLRRFCLFQPTPEAQWKTSLRIPGLDSLTRQLDVLMNLRQFKDFALNVCFLNLCGSVGPDVECSSVFLQVRGDVLPGRRSR